MANMKEWDKKVKELNEKLDENTKVSDEHLEEQNQVIKEICEKGMAVNANEIKRVNIRVSSKVHEYYMARSLETGVSMSALMALALEDHMVQRQMVGVLNGVEQLQEIVKGGR